MSQVAIQQDHSLSPIVLSETAAIINLIDRAARDPAVDVEKLRQLMQMRDAADLSHRERAFDEAMAHAQEKMRPVAADCTNNQTSSRYASYAALDRALRPIYSAEGFALSFNTLDCPQPDYVRVQCRVSMGGFSRLYQIDMPADGKGPKGNSVMTRTHATGSAVSYGMRYLLKMIFNVAVGEDDDDGNRAGGYIHVEPDPGRTQQRGPERPAEKITAEQAQEIRIKIDAAKKLKADDGSSKFKADSFWSFAGVDAGKFEDIPADRYRTIISGLKGRYGV